MNDVRLWWQDNSHRHTTFEQFDSMELYTIRISWTVTEVITGIIVLVFPVEIRQNRLRLPMTAGFAKFAAGRSVTMG